MITVKELRDILAYCNDDTEVKLFVKDLPAKTQFWYFAIVDAKQHKDGLYIELE